MKYKIIAVHSAAYEKLRVYAFTHKMKLTELIDQLAEDLPQTAADKWEEKATEMGIDPDE